MIDPAEQDPFLLLNGEPASEDELVLLEALASTLLGPMETETVRQYYLETENGSFLRLETCYVEGGNAPQSGVSISIAEGDFEEERFSLFFDSANNFKGYFLADGYSYPEIEILADDLLDSDVLDPAERAVAQHCRTVLRNLQGAPLPEPSICARPLPDVVREKVNKKCRFEVRTKEYQMPLDDDHVVSIAQNEVRELLSGEVLDTLPIVQVEFEDRIKGTGHCYTKMSGGIRELESYFLKDMQLGEPDVGTSQEDDVVAEFNEALNANMPGKHDTHMITTKLLEALQIDGLV